MYELIYLLAGGTAAIVALVAIWAARSSVHWFWRAAALLACFLLLVPVGAAELNLLFAPVAGILFLASAGQQWWQRRRQHLDLAAGDEQRGRESIRAEALPLSSGSDPNRLPTPSVRFSLKELFLVILLAAVAAWIAARIVQEGIVMDWRKLPIAVALVAAVAWIASVWVEKPRTWQPFWAKAAAYLIGLAMIPVSINGLMYGLQWESAVDITIAAACFVCLTMIVTYSWLIHVGRMPQTLLLAAAIYAATYVHANYVGDWLAADYLLIEQRPTFWLVQRIMYGLLYFHLAAFVLLGVLVWRGLALPPHKSWRNFAFSRLSMTVPLLLLLPVAWLYWHLLQIRHFASAAAIPDATRLSEANRILAWIQTERMAAPAASAAFDLPDTPKMRQLSRELFAALESPTPEALPTEKMEDFAAVQIRTAEMQRLLNIAAQVFSAGQIHDFPDGNCDPNSDFALAQVRYAYHVQREGLATNAFGAYFFENSGHLVLAVQHDELSANRRREVLRGLRELDRRRESLDSLLARDAVWSERHERWRSRLRRVVLGREDSVDYGHPFDTLRERYNHCVATARLNMTNMAIRLFQEERGQLPASLQELVPEYLDAVPTDPHSGQPMIYRPAPGGFALYSVGPDGEDDGGVQGLDGVFDQETIVRTFGAQMARAKAAAQAAGKTPAAANVPSMGPGAGKQR